MPKNLVIVESPAKAKTIEKYLGKDYMVKSSYGHVRDLPKGNSAIDISNNYQPVYEISPDKQKVVKELRSLSKQAETIWLATDNDREGEAISWHLKEALHLNDTKTRRIIFREITKKAILNAISAPRGIDIDLVDAQQARRILDRLVGFELSPVLWKKIKRGLSAGRVQSVAVRMIVERERSIENFIPQISFKTTGLFETKEKKQLRAQLAKNFDEKEKVFAFLEDCKSARFFVKKLEKKPGKKSPAPPFTTSTLQQEASRKLGFSVSRTMLLAQKLYEAGHITYMRTDSVTLSEEAIRAAAAQIQNMYGQEYVQVRQFKNTSKSAQEAHEAIRPTDFTKMQAGQDTSAQRLYELICKRATASQMADARLEKTTVTVGAKELADDFRSIGEIITFEGFLKVYVLMQDEEGDAANNQDTLLPALSVGEPLAAKNIVSRERFSKHPPRYTEASLVRELEHKGIGRPSTYAPTISTIQKRNYVIKESRDGFERTYLEIILEDKHITSKEKTELRGVEKSKLFPTQTGRVVNDFLVDHFSSIVDYSFTASVEEEFDLIAEGKTKWTSMIDAFYGGFHQTVKATETNAERVLLNQIRNLGEDPNSGRSVYAKQGKFGPYVQIGEQDDKEKVYSSLQKGQVLEKITLKEALELFKLPRHVGTLEEKEIIADIGRFGPYVKHDSKFFSLGKIHNPLTIDEKTAIQLIQDKRITDSKRIIKLFDGKPPIRLLNGKWGPYIAFNNKNFKIPKDQKAEELTLEACMKIIQENQQKKKGGKSKT